MRRRFRELCEEFAVKWISEAGEHFAGDGTQEEFEANLEIIRAVTWQSAAHVMAEEIEASSTGSMRSARRCSARDRFPQGATLAPRAAGWSTRTVIPLLYSCARDVG